MTGALARLPAGPERHAARRHCCGRQTDRPPPPPTVNIPAFSLATNYGGRRAVPPPSLHPDPGGDPAGLAVPAALRMRPPPLRPPNRLRRGERNAGVDAQRGGDLF